jgi:hypothetical protein
VHTMHEAFERQLSHTICVWHFATCISCLYTIRNWITPLLIRLSRLWTPFTTAGEEDNATSTDGDGGTGENAAGYNGGPGEWAPSAAIDPDL